MAQFEDIKHKFPNLTTLCDFQIPLNYYDSIVAVPVTRT